MACDRCYKAGDSWQVEGGRWQMVGARCYKAGDSWQVEGGRWQMVGSRCYKTADSWQVAGGRCQVADIRSTPDSLRKSHRSSKGNSRMNPSCRYFHFL